MLINHRRALLYSLLLLASLAFILFAVGRHPPSEAPATSFAFVGRFDQNVYNWMQNIRITPLTWVFRALNVIGGGIVTIPLRSIGSLILLIRRRWWQFSAFVLTWAASEILLTLTKSYFHRGRPPGSLVSTTGFSFPSGHAVAAAATAVGLVLAFLPPGGRRRKWELVAVAFAFVMALSRVYLNAHWFADVVSGVLLGSGIALGSAALVWEIHTLAPRRRGVQPAAGTG